jgi:alpha-galactosidase
VRLVAVEYADFPAVEWTLWPKNTGKDKIWLNTGTWEVDTAKYPHGFKPYSDKLRGSGMQFLLWFEPERHAPGLPDDGSWVVKWEGLKEVQ